MANYMTVSSDKSKKMTLILCAVGGIFGLHDFYLLRIGSGLVKLCTGNWLCIGWLCDLVKIAIGSYRDNVGAPIRN